MFKNMLALKQKLASTKVFFKQPKRLFNVQLKPPTSSKNILPLLLIGGGTAGLAYLSYYGH